MDLASGHVGALEYMLKRHEEDKVSFYEVFNLGTGVGCSVLDMVRAMEKV